MASPGASLSPSAWRSIFGTCSLPACSSSCECGAWCGCSTACTKWQSVTGNDVYRPYGTGRYSIKEAPRVSRLTKGGCGPLPSSLILLYASLSLSLFSVCTCFSCKTRWSSSCSSNTVCAVSWSWRIVSCWAGGEVGGIKQRGRDSETCERGLRPQVANCSGERERARERERGARERERSERKSGEKEWREKVREKVCGYEGSGRN